MTNIQDFVQNPMALDKPVNNFIKIDDVLAEKSLDVAFLVDRVVSVLHSRGVNVPTDHEGIIEILCRVFISDLTEKKPIVLPVDPGLGKSTTLEEYLKYSAESDPSFGAVVVKERKEDLLALQKQLGHKAFVLYGFDQDCLKKLKDYSRAACRDCTAVKCRVKTNYKRQQYYPILLLAMERFVGHVDFEQNIKTLMTWRNGDIIEKRSILVIDERPPMAVCTPVTIDALTRVSGVIGAISPETKLHEQSKKFLERLHPVFWAYIQAKACTVNSVDKKYSLPKGLTDFFYRDYEGNDVEIIRSLESIIKKGGVYVPANPSSSTSKILTRHYIDYSMLSDIKTVILDGTARHDFEYRQDMFCKLDIDPYRTYENLTILNCADWNTSRNSLIKKRGWLEELAKDLDIIAADSKILLVTYKFLVNDIKKVLQNLANSDNIQLDYFGGLKGKNGYANCDKVIIVGLTHKGDQYYLAKAGAVYGIDTDGIKVSSRNGGRHYDHALVQSLADNDITIELVQCILRIHLRKGVKKNAQVYTFLRDQRHAQMLGEYFSGCQIKTWVPQNLTRYLLSDRSPRVVRLHDAITHTLAAKGNSVFKNVLMEEAGYKNYKTFRKDMASPYIQELLLSLNIEIRHQTLAKVA